MTKTPVRKRHSERILALAQQEMSELSEWISVKNDLGLRFPQEHLSEGYKEWLSSFDEEEIRTAGKMLSAVLMGNVTALPKICPSLSKCEHKGICPFQTNQPVGKACPMEMSVIIDRMNKLMEQFKIDGFQQTDFMILNRVVELELYDLRLNSLMSSQDKQSILVDKVVGFSSEGSAITNEEVSPLFDLKEKISREKMKLMTLLVGTPQEVYKKRAALKEASTDKLSVKIDELNRALQQVEKSLEPAT